RSRPVHRHHHLAAQSSCALHGVAMSKGVTDADYPAPKPPKRAHWAWNVLAIIGTTFLLCAALIAWIDARHEPDPPVVVTRIVPQTVVVTHDVDHYWTVPPIEVTRETTRTITVPVTVEVTRIVYEPAGTPPQNGKG